MGCSPWGCYESGTTERLHFYFSLSCIGEGNGNPLQCSCLENPRDGGDWWAVVYGVAQSRTRWSDLAAAAAANPFILLLSSSLPNVFSMWQPGDPVKLNSDHITLLKPTHDLSGSDEEPGNNEDLLSPTSFTSAPPSLPAWDLLLLLPALLTQLLTSTKGQPWSQCRTFALTTLHSLGFSFSGHPSG